MTKNQLIEKKTDTLNGKYAVLYKAESDTVSFIELFKLNEEFAKNIETMLDETKNNPLIILDMIHQLNKQAFVIIIEKIQKNKQKITKEEREYLEDVFLDLINKILTRILMKATIKRIDNIDIKQMEISYAKKQNELWEKVAKRYENLGNQ